MIELDDLHKDERDKIIDYNKPNKEDFDRMRSIAEQFAEREDKLFELRVVNVLKKYGLL
jgi:hypothetical protein